QELAGQVVERNLPSIRRFEAEGLHVVGQILYLGERKLAKPSDLAGRGIILLVPTRLAPQHRGLRQDLDPGMARAGGGEALAEGEKQLGIAFNADLPAQQSQRQALLLGEEAEPGLGIGGHADIRLADQAVLDIERSISDGDRRRALLRSREV